MYFYHLGFFCLGVPEIIYCNYDGDEVHDVLIIENLLDTGYITLNLAETTKGKNFWNNCMR